MTSDCLSVKVKWLACNIRGKFEADLVILENLVGLLFLAFRIAVYFFTFRLPRPHYQNLAGVWSR